MAKLFCDEHMKRTLSYPPFHPDGIAPNRLAMSAAEFKRAFPGEGQFIEFKRGTSSEQLQNTAVAFSNADGGVIVVGVGDDGQVLGRAADAGTQDAIHEAVQGARDVGRYSIHALDVDGTGITVVAVARRREGFSQTSAGTVRVRHGTRDDALFGAELVRFANERTSSRYEITPVNAQTGVASPALRRELGAAMSWDRVTAQRLEEAELTADGQLTVAGALYLLSDPALVLGKTYLEVLRFDDDHSTEYDRRWELRGPIHHVFRTAVELIDGELGTDLVVLGVQRYELNRLPIVVLREALANALAHRSYEMGGTAVRVELRPTAVIVRSPGGLPEPVTVDNIREANAARNVVVIKVLRALGLAEDAGRGVDVMQDTMIDEMLEPPRFSDSGHEVIVELPIRSAVTPSERAWVHELERRGALRGLDRVALVHAARGAVLTNKALRELLSIDSEAARETLQRLRDEGFLEQRGQRGGASYRLAGSLRPPAGLRLRTEELDVVVLKLADSGPIANADVRAATGLDRAEARALLDRLVKDGQLRRTGERRGTKYARI
jgi:ATP-dependent DNA helicase RecG